jgi:D-3-phosphoglycerate dehydrogenase
MAEVKVYNAIAEEGLKVLEKKGFTLTDAENPEAIILRSENLNEMELPKNLVGVARAGAGVNNIPVDRMTENGIVVFNTPGANANAVSELVLASMIVAIRQMIPANIWAGNLTGDDISKQVEKGKKQFKGTEIKGKTLGVIGLGSIGHLVANAAIDLGMTVIGYDPYLKKDPADKLDRYVQRVEDLKEIYEQSDFITVHVPAIESNHHLIDKTAIEQMNTDTILLNFSRDMLVDDEAVVKALDAGQLTMYLTDFPTAELIGREDCLVFPHLGASTIEAEKICAVMAASQLSDFIQTGNIKNAVNFPNVEMEIETDTRIAIVNRNVPNMLSLLVDEIGQHNINIVHFMNKSKGEYAYTLIELDETDPALLEDLVQNIRKAENILSARLIKKNI